MSRLWVAPLLLTGALVLGGPVRAQSAGTAPSPSQIQSMINAGQEGQAVQALQNVLESHPKSGVAWYLLAEAYDAQNNEVSVGTALNMAERSDPGLPFANPQEVAALKAHIAAAQPQSGGSGGHTAILVIVGLLLLMLVLRFLPGRDTAARNYGYTAPPPPPGTPPYGFGYNPTGAGAGMGSALMGGLAAGAGFAAGERIIDGLAGRGGPAIDPNFPPTGFPQGPDPSRDDGLMGNPGWDNSSGPSDDDLSNTGWS
jgi:uncharacterized protein